MIHLAVFLLSVIPLAPRTDVRTVTLICGQGWQAGAVGQVGGVSFSVQCQNGRGKARLVGVSNTSYGARVGVESDIVAADCFYSGDAAVVDVSCLEVQLSIR
jgi:hypothetical protein